MPSPAHLEAEAAALKGLLLKQHAGRPPSRPFATLMSHHNDLSERLAAKPPKPPESAHDAMQWPCTSPVHAMLLLGSGVVEEIEREAVAAKVCGRYKPVFIFDRANRRFSEMSKAQQQEAVARFKSLRPELEKLKEPA